MTGIVKVNNALLDYDFSTSSEITVHYSVWFFSGSVPTIEELEDSRTDTPLSMTSLRNLIAADKSRTLLAQVLTESKYPTKFYSEEDLYMRLASDPRELTVTTEGTPTFAIVVGDESIHDFATPSAQDDVLVSLAVATVGDFDSGKDIELLGGELLMTNTYKVNSFRIHIPEL